MECAPREGHLLEAALGREDKASWLHRPARLSPTLGFVRSAENLISTISHRRHQDGDDKVQRAERKSFELISELSCFNFRN